jgi:sugar porter (SP) family MFS transporter
MASKLESNPIHMEHTRGRQFRVYNILMVLLMSAGSMSYGYSASIIATTLAQPSFLAYFNLAGPHASSNANQLIATMNGLYQAGGFLAVFSTSFLADKWGRKMAIAVSAVITILAGALLAGSVHIAMFIVFRFVSGAGAFMILAAVPVWMNEVVPPSIRGVLVDIHGAALLFGYMLATWIGYGFYLYTPTGNVQWRAPLAIQVVWPTILLCGLYWMPESPRWLLINSRAEEANNILRKLHTPEEAAIEYIQIKKQMEIDARLPSSYTSMFTKPSYRKRTLIGIATTCSVQFSGILVINNYGPTLYAGLGFDTNTQFLYQGGWITLAFGCGVLSLLFVDRFPRNKFIAFGIAGCMACLIVECALDATYASTSALAKPNETALKAAVAMIYVYVVFYEICLDGVQFAYIGEIFPTHLRAKGIALGVAGICLMNVIWLQGVYLLLNLPPFYILPIPM